MSKKNKKKSAKRWAIVFAIEVVLILILIPVVFVFAKLSKINTASEAEISKADIIINEDIDIVTQEVLKGYRNIALFGVDSRDGSLEGETRSDSIIIVSINQDTKQVKMVSVYRDTALYVPDYGYTKATHAYAYGGAQLAINMLNENLDLNITEFATVDFGVLANIIDALGGIEIEVSEAEFELINPLVKEQNRATGSDSPYLEGPGLQTLNGTQAVAYARIRKIDSDFVRAERQRTVLAKMLEKAKKADIGTLLDIVDTVLPQVYTNLKSTDIISLAKDVFSYNLAGQDGFPFEKTTGEMDGLSYVFAVDFLGNVKQLHSYFFGADNYVPSSTVTTISEELYYKTGY